ncbi:hypothetical protein TI04_00340 [Achromatium sp. WMS2]|nr:hypothetical protein TI04_00340 [Achromatium sp. WMS2]
MEYGYFFQHNRRFFKILQILILLVLTDLDHTHLVWADQAPIIINSGQVEIAVPNPTASIVVIEQTEIVDSGAKNLGELLQGQAGLNIRSESGDTAKAVVDMRGFGATAGSNTLILVDGRRLNNSSDLAPPDLSEIDMATVERVEIIQGSAGTLFGNQAVGGVINIITKIPDQSGVKARIGGGSFGNYEANAQITGQLAARTNYQLQVSRQSGSQERDRTLAKRDNVGLRLDHQYHGGNVFFRLQHKQDDSQLPGSLFQSELAANRLQSVAAYQGDFSDIETSIAQIGLQHNVNTNWKLAGEVNYRENNGHFQMSGRGWTSRFAQKRKILGFNPRITGPIDIFLTDAQLIVGADYETTDYEFASNRGLQNEVQDTYSVYAHLNTALTTDLRLNVGLRRAEIRNSIENGGTHYDLDDGITVASLGLEYDPMLNWRLFARWDQNYRFATVDEHTNVLFTQPVGLKNQTGDSYEFGAIYHTGDIKLQALMYALRLHNEISFDSSTWFNINLPDTERYGGIIEANWALNRLWSLGGDYTYTSSRITAGPFEGNDIPLVPKHSGRLFVDYADISGWGIRVTGHWLGARALGGDFANNFNTLPSYEIVDIAMRYQFGPWSISGKINNVLDHKYNATGAIGFDPTIFANAPAYFPASGRSFWLTLDYTP